MSAHTPLTIAISENRVADALEFTPLILAIKEDRVVDALALVASGGSDLGFVSSTGTTVFMLACQSCNIDVALALIATGKSRPETLDMHSNGAIVYARRKRYMYKPGCADMEKVVAALVALGCY
jgi:ankyrin repeat protein